MPRYQAIATFRRPQPLGADEVEVAAGLLRELGAELLPEPATIGASEGGVDVRVRVRITTTWPTAAVARVVELVDQVAADGRIDLGAYRGVQVQQE